VEAMKPKDVQLVAGPYSLDNKLTQIRHSPRQLICQPASIRYSPCQLICQPSSSHSCGFVAFELWIQSLEPLESSHLTTSRWWAGAFGEGTV